jgi:hypothetical protein
MGEQNETPSNSDSPQSVPASDAQSTSSPVAPPPAPTLSASAEGSRSELISRARMFLSSPQIQSQDIFAK